MSSRTCPVASCRGTSSDYLHTMKVAVKHVGGGFSTFSSPMPKSPMISSFSGPRFFATRAAIAWLGSCTVTVRPPNTDLWSIVTFVFASNPAAERSCTGQPVWGHRQSMSLMGVIHAGKTRFCI